MVAQDHITWHWMVDEAYSSCAWVSSLYSKFLKPKTQGRSGLKDTPSCPQTEGVSANRGRPCVFSFISLKDRGGHRRKSLLRELDICNSVHCLHKTILHVVPLAFKCSPKMQDLCLARHARKMRDYRRNGETQIAEQYHLPAMQLSTRKCCAPTCSLPVSHMVAWSLVIDRARLPVSSCLMPMPLYTAG